MGPLKVGKQVVMGQQRRQVVMPVVMRELRKQVVLRRVKVMQKRPEMMQRLPAERRALIMLKDVEIRKKDGEGTGTGTGGIRLLSETDVIDTKKEINKCIRSK